MTRSMIFKTLALFTVVAALVPVTATADVPTGSVTIQVELMPSPYQNGDLATQVYGTFLSTGALDASGTAYGARDESGLVSLDPLVYGTTWWLQLTTDAGTLQVYVEQAVDSETWEALPPTWTIWGGTGAYAGTTGGGSASGVYGTAIDPWTGWPTWTMDWTLTGSVGPCPLSAPVLYEATPGDRQVALAWSDESSDPDVLGYAVYRDTGSGPAFVADVGLATTWTDTFLTNGVTYCYTVTAYGASCESLPSNERCATPTGPPRADVSALETGKWVKSGKGRNATTAFVLTTSFTRGDEIVFRARVVDRETGDPLPGAVVDLWVQGPETRVLTSDPADGDGYAEARWKTASPGKKKDAGGGTAPGAYTAHVTGVSASGYAWDGPATSTAFTID